VIKRARVLAIGIDAADAALVRDLAGRGDLPSLARLLTRGRFGRVTSPASIGSGAIWPTFVSGLSPREHGLYSGWSWEPERMRIAPVNVDGLRPFWASPELEDFSLGVLDVPWAPMANLHRGIEVNEWGPHDILHGRMQVSPPGLRTLVQQSGGAYPITRPDGRGKPAGRREIARMVSRGREAARLRGALAERLLSEIELDLFLTVFSEIHHAAHFLWHTVDGAAPAAGPGLLDLYREVDRQVGRLVAAADPSASVLVFSLHGMRFSRGVVTILDPLLRAAGLACVGSFGNASAAEKMTRALTAVKRRAPLFLKKAAYRLMTRGMALRILRPSLMPAYDWRRTIAFPIPSDQHGWIRVNLAGREAQGSVPRERYRETCDRIESLLRGLITEEGQPLVREVLRLGEPPHDPPARLPDLIAHWSDAAMAHVLRIRAPAMTAPLSATKVTGQHAPDGFFLLAPGSATSGEPGDAIAAADLHRVILGLLPATARR
jgi:predicted AlkP superfamily phosphohydrolase/phosphomutase